MTRVLSLSLAASLLILLPVSFSHVPNTSNVLNTLQPILYMLSALSILVSNIMLFNAILMQPIVIFGVLASYLLGTALACTFSPLLKVFIEICISSERVKEVEREATLVRDLMGKLMITPTSPRLLA